VASRSSEVNFTKNYVYAPLPLQYTVCAKQGPELELRTNASKDLGHTLADFPAVFRVW